MTGPRRRGIAPVLAVLAAGALLSLGCRGDTSSRSPWHLNPNMDRQPKYLPQAESGFFGDGATMRQPVEGTVARGQLDEDTALYRGVDAGGALVASSPLAATPEVLTRGEERYGIFCTPCHGDNGRGRGALYERAGVQSGDMIEDPRIRGLSDGEMFDVITNGVGLMSGYRYPIPPQDRWAIIAYVRQLQAEGGPAPAAEPAVPVAEPAVPVAEPAVAAAAGEGSGAG